MWYFYISRPKLDFKKNKNIICSDNFAENRQRVFFVVFVFVFVSVFVCLFVVYLNAISNNGM